MEGGDDDGGGEREREGEEEEEEEVGPKVLWRILRHRTVSEAQSEMRRETWERVVRVEGSR